MAHQNAGDDMLGPAMTKTEIFFEKNGKRLVYALLGVAVVVTLFFSYRSLVVAPRVEKATEMIAQAQNRFESAEPNFELALTGDANGAGFLDVIEKYGATPSGNLARHYAGICYLRMGDLENAAKYLAKFSHVKGIPGSLINAQNLGLQGDVAVEQGSYPQAVKFYERAAAASDNDLTAPLYLYKAGLAEQAAGNGVKAAEFYNRVLDKHPASFYAREAEKRMGTL